jgi:streptogramin lyase
LISSASTGFELAESKISVSPSLPAAFSAGPNTISFVLNNTGKMPVSSGVLDISMKDPDGAEVFSAGKTFAIAVGESSAINVAVNVPSLKFGTYTLSYKQSDETQTGSPVNLQIKNTARIGLATDKSVYNIGETATVTISLYNDGKFECQGALTVDTPFSGSHDSGAVTVSPSATYTKTYSFALPVTLSADEIVKAIFTIESGEQLVSEIKLYVDPVTVSQNMLFDNSSYRIRETLGMNLTATAHNFVNQIAATYSITIPDLNYSSTGQLILEPGVSVTLPFSAILPETLPAGQHDVFADIVLPSGIVYEDTFSFTNPKSNLVITGPDAAAFAAGDIFGLMVENTGGVDTIYTTEKVSATDNNSVAILQENIAGTVNAGEKKLLTSIQIPQQTVTGNLFLQAVLNNVDSGLKASYYKNVYIDGIAAALSARTDKEHYFKIESISAISALTNTNLNIEEGLLDIKIRKPVEDETAQFKQFLPKSGEWLFDYISGVAVSRDNYLYAVDNRNYDIWKFNSSGDLITKWGGYGSDNGKFYSPWAIAVAGDGSVFVLDRDYSTIQKFDSDGIFISKWGKEGYDDGQFSSPKDIAIANDNTIYVADGYNYRIQKFDGNGNFVTKFGSYGNGDGQFFNPYSLAVDSVGFVYVTDYSQNRIQKFDSNGNFITKWGSNGSGDGQFESPRGIAVGPDSSVYVVDTWNSRIQKFDGNGNFIDKWGSYGSGDGQFYLPQHGIAVGPDSSVYVADTFNDRIQKLISQSDVLFETTIPITQSANTAQDYTTNVGLLNATGKLYLQAELRNSLGQTIAMSEYPFYIIDGDTLLLFSTDKKYYSPNETVTISGEVRNRASIDASMLGLQLSNNSQDIYNAIFDVPANGRAPFTATTTAGTEGLYTLSGKLTQNGSTHVEISDQYEVSNPKVSATVSGPDMVGNEPFDVRVEIKNEGKVNARVQLSAINSQSETIDAQQITIPAGETKQVRYSRQITSETTYTFILTGDLNQSITKKIEYGLNASVSVNVSEIYPEGKIIIPYFINNTGVLDAAYPVVFILVRDGQEISKNNTTVTLPVAGSSLGSLSYNLSEGLYTLKYETAGFTGEVQVNVVKPGQGEIALGMNDVYPEGTISIPYTITNTGQFDSEFTVEFALGANIASKKVFIPAGVAYPDMLRYSLSAGSYTITAAITSYPSTPASKNFVVLKEIGIDMNVSIGSQTNGLIPVAVNLTNTGNNEINGSVQLSLITSQGTSVWNSSQKVSLSANPQYPIQNSHMFNINPSAITPGAYTLKAELLNNSNQQLAVSSQLLFVSGALIQITQLPSYKTFAAGEVALFTFKIKNTGNQEGAAELALRAYDLADMKQREWLAAGQEKEIVFSFMLPSDLESKDYFADYTLTPSGDGVIKGQVKYHLAGINLNVNADLNKQNYAVGDTVRLTLNIQSPTPNPQSLFARANYAGYEDQKTFILTGSTSIAFDVPLSHITGEKLFYGIYHESGRSIHLNSLYIYKSGDAITIATNKQVYNPGESVSVSVTGNTSGAMTLSGPGYSETFAFSGTASKSFILPQTMTAGTYSISADLTAANGKAYSVQYPIDIAGIQVKVLECRNNKGKYASSDTITTELTISGNTTLPALLKTWIVDPEGKYTPAGETSINLNATDNALVSHNSSLLTSVSGIHRLIYGIYSEDLLLVSGSEAFDVGDAVLLGLKTDKIDYPTNTEVVKTTATIYGSVPADMELQLDGLTVRNESIVLDGFSALEMDLGSVTPGPHILKGILTAGGLKSAKEMSFVYGSNLPDLTTAISYQQSAISNDNTVEMTATVTNQGRTATAATTIALYDGDALIGMQPVNALNSGESQEIAFVWNVLGRAGEHKIKAVVDPDNTVMEFNEENNAAILSVAIPDLALTTGTDKDTYKINRHVLISSTIRSLSSEKTFGSLTLMTTVKDPTGSEVYANTAVITDIQPLSTKTDTAVWNTTGLTAEGTYTISRQLLADSQVLAQSAKTVELIKTPDFSINAVSGHKSVRQGEQATYTISLEPLNGWSSPITLTLPVLPEGTSILFNPDNLLPPGQVLAVFITSSATTAGSYTLDLAAEGMDDGEHVSHILPLTLDVSDATPPTGSVTINDNDVFTKNSTVTLNLHATDESGVAKMCISNTASCAVWEYYAVTRSWALLSGDGARTVYVWYQDSPGNINALPYSATITLDTTPPALTVSTLADGRWTNSELLNVSGEAADRSGLCDILINDVIVPTNSDGTFSCPVLLADGPNTIITRATDPAGNETSDIRTITLDRSRPDITILKPADNMKTNQPALDVTGVVDEASTVAIRLDNTTPVAALMDGNTFSRTVSPQYGINTIEATATDLAGNSSTAKRTVTFDDIKPALSVTEPAQDVKTRQADLTVKGEVQDLTSIAITITMDGNTYSPAVTGGSFEQPVTFTEQMTYQINVEAVDDAGNVSSVQRHILFDTTGPVVTLNPVTSPTSLTGQVLTGTMESGSTVSVRCMTATVSAVAYPTATTWSVALSDMQDGNNEITATAMDEAGNISAPVSAAISVYLPLTQISAEIDFDPNTLNQKSRGKWVTVHIELPAGFNVADIDILSLRLNGTIPAEQWPYAIGDYDHNGIQDVMVKFDRNAVLNRLPSGDKVKITVTGTVGATTFEGADYIRVIH